MGIRLVLRAVLPLAVGLTVMTAPVYAASPGFVTIQILDQCDPATFNANVAPGACVGTGTVTFTTFLDEVSRLGRAPQWHFAPPQRQLTVGQTFHARNLGGETHTFTEVEKFGGGIVPFLNKPAGFTTLAPECTDGTPDVLTLNGKQLLKPAAGFLASVVPPGGFFPDTEGANDVGHPVLYQCCIHPWMHEVITVQPK